jgi:hypothetical protein
VAWDERVGDGWAGGIGGWTSIAGDGYLDDRGWYFSAKGDSWLLQFAATVDGNPFADPQLLWQADYLGACEMHVDEAWRWIMRAFAWSRDPLTRAMLANGRDRDAAWRASIAWPAMAKLAAREGGPAQVIARALREFGVGAGDTEWPWLEPIAFGLDVHRSKHEASLAQAGDELRMDRAIADAIRAVWPLPHRAQP